jgi:hypothetical protein
MRLLYSVALLALFGCSSGCPDGYTCTQNVSAIPSPDPTPSSAIEKYIGTVGDCRAYELNAYAAPIAVICPKEDTSVKALKGVKIRHWVQTDTVHR